MKRFFAITTVLLTSVSWATGQETPQAYVGAEIIPIAGPVIPSGVLIIQRGKILAVGPAASTTVPRRRPCPPMPSASTPAAR